MKPETNGIKGLLVLVALLLAANLVATLSAREPGAAVVVPSAQAGQVLKIDGPVLVTTNDAGDAITVWQLGRYVNDGYESVKARTYDAASSRH